MDAIEEVEDGAVAADQPDRLADDVLEDLLGLAHDRDARGDLPQGLLRLRAATERVAGAVQLLDQSCRRDRDGGLVGDRDEERRVGLAPQRRRHPSRW